MQGMISRAAKGTRPFLMIMLVSFDPDVLVTAIAKVLNGMKPVWPDTSACPALTIESSNVCYIELSNVDRGPLSWVSNLEIGAFDVDLQRRASGMAIRTACCRSRICSRASALEMISQ